MKTKRVIGIILLSLIATTMVGCVGARQRTEESIIAYNEEVLGVISKTETTKQDVNERIEEILVAVQKEDGEIDGIVIEGEVSVKGAEKIDMLRNEFFTSLNAQSIRQVIVITKGNDGMYIELIWKNGKLEKGTRRAIHM